MRSIDATTFNVVLGNHSRYEGMGFLEMYWNLSAPGPIADIDPASVGLVVHNGRLEALLTEMQRSTSPTWADKGVRHVPYADGIASTGLIQDHDDGAEMNTSLCQSLRCAAKCALWSNSCSSPSPELAGPCVFEAP